MDNTIENIEFDEKDKHKLFITTQDDREVECDILLSFYLRDIDKSYIYFTDNTRNENGKLNVYIYYVILTDEGEEFYQVTDDTEFELLTKIYNNTVEGMKKNG